MADEKNKELEESLRNLIAEEEKSAGASLASREEAEELISSLLEPTEHLGIEELNLDYESYQSADFSGALPSVEARPPIKEEAASKTETAHTDETIDEQVTSKETSPAPIFIDEHGIVKRHPSTFADSNQKVASLMSQYNEVMSGEVVGDTPKKKGFFSKIRTLFSRKKEEDTFFDLYEEDSEYEDEEGYYDTDYDDEDFFEDAPLRDSSNEATASMDFTMGDFYATENHTAVHSESSKEHSNPQKKNPSAEEPDVRKSIADKLSQHQTSIFDFNVDNRTIIPFASHNHTVESSDFSKLKNAVSSETAGITYSFDKLEEKLSTSVFSLTTDVESSSTNEIAGDVDTPPSAQKETLPTEARMLRPLYSAGEREEHFFGADDGDHLSEDDLDELTGASFAAATGEGEEFRSFAETPAKLAWLDQKITFHFVKCVFLSLVSLITVFLNLPIYFPSFPSFPFANPVTNPSGLFVVNLALLLISCVLYFDGIVKAFKDFIKLHFNVHTSILLGVFFSIILLLLGAKNTSWLENLNFHIYAPLFTVSMLFQSIAMLIRFMYTKANFRIVSSNREKLSLEFLESPAFESAVVTTIGNPDAMTVSTIKTNFWKRFLEFSTREDDSYYQVRVNRLLYGISYIIALLVSITCLVVSGSTAEMLSLFTGLLAVTASFSALLTQILPLYKASSTLAPKGSFLTNTNAIHDYGSLSALTINAADLFPKGSIRLIGLRTFGEARIDEAILDVCSVTYYMKASLAHLFLEMVGGNTKILPPLDTIEYEEGRGAVAWTKGKRILVGNSELLRSYQIETPSTEYEAKYRKGGNDLIYIANSGKLTAMYIVNYRANKKIRNALQSLIKSNVDLLFHTNDSNITTDKICTLFALPLDRVHIMGEKMLEEHSHLTKPRKEANAFAGTIGGFKGYLATAIAAIKLSSVLSILRYLLIISMGLGILSLSFMGLFYKIFTGISQVSPFSILLYELFIVLLVYLINKIKQIR